MSDAKPFRDRILLNRIRLDGGTQPRVEMDLALIDEYAAVVDQLPPVDLVFDGKAYWPTDGFHRIEAHRKARRKEILASIVRGTRRDAILLSLAVNAQHGLRRTNADIRRAVETMLRDPEWSQWSNHKIAEHCAVHHQTVANHRKLLEGAQNNGPAESGELSQFTPAESQLPEEFIAVFDALTPEQKARFAQEQEAQLFREQAREDARTWLERVEADARKLGARFDARPEVKLSSRKKVSGWLDKVLAEARKYEA